MFDFVMCRGLTAGQLAPIEKPVQIRRNFLQRQIIKLVTMRATDVVYMFTLGLLRR